MLKLLSRWAYFVDKAAAVESEVLMTGKVTKLENGQAWFHGKNENPLFFLRSGLTINFIPAEVLKKTFVDERFRDQFELLTGPRPVEIISSQPFVIDLLRINMEMLSKNHSAVVLDPNPAMMRATINYAAKYRFEHLEKQTRICIYVPYDIKQDFNKLLGSVSDHHWRCVEADLNYLLLLKSHEEYAHFIRHVPLYTVGFYCDLILNGNRKTVGFSFTRSFVGEINDALFVNGQKVADPVLILDELMPETYYKEETSNAKYMFLRMVLSALNLFVFGSGPIIEGNYMIF